MNKVVDVDVKNTVNSAYPVLKRQANDIIRAISGHVLFGNKVTLNFGGILDTNTEFLKLLQTMLIDKIGENYTDHIRYTNLSYLVAVNLGRVNRQ